MVNQKSRVSFLFPLRYSQSIAAGSFGDDQRMTERADRFEAEQFWLLGCLFHHPLTEPLRWNQRISLAHDQIDRSRLLLA